MLVTLLLIAVLALAAFGLFVIAFLVYVAAINIRFNKRNPHARDAANLRMRVEAQVVGGFFEDAVRIYRELRELIAAHPSEPDLVRYQMEAAELIARTATDRRDIETALELYRDVQDVTHVAVMAVLRDLMPSFLSRDRGKALVCVELLARHAERNPKHAYLYLSAKRKFEGRLL